MQSLDVRSRLVDVGCIALVVFICVGVFATFLVAAVVNQAWLLTRNLNPSSREAVIR